MKKREQKGKKKFKWQQYIAVVIFALIGGLCGVLIGELMSRTDLSGDSSSRTLLLGAGMLVMVYVSMVLQIIIHEAGHLVFGLLTGYRFSSFRIFSLMLVKENGKLRIKRLSLAGTGGQCLMVPPDMVDGKLPTVLYNLGGSIMNIATSLVFLVLYFLCSGLPVFSVVMLFLAIIGFAFAMMNGVPMRLGTVDNDGYNALSLRKDPRAMEAFWVQMKVNDKLSGGIRLKDMPEEWFTLPPEEAMGNPLIATVGVFACNRLMDAHRFCEADDLMKQMLDMDSGMVGLHRALMVCDRMYVELIGDNRRDVLESMLTKEQKKVMKQMRNYPSVLRTQYVLALCRDKDEEQATKWKAAFKKISRTYPYQTDIESERELISIAENECFSL